MRTLLVPRFILPFVLLSVVSLAACAPAGMESAEVGSAEQASTAPEKYTVVKVFYGTDRERHATDDPNALYGGGRGALEYGTARVSIPREHKLGELESPKWYRLEFTENPEKHIVLLGAVPGSAAEVLGQLRAAVARADAPEVLVFIHGFNVSFKDAARRTAQIAYDLNFPGIPALYSWPSNGKLLDYNADESDAQWSAPNLREFLESVRASSGAQRIHLIAHSMGNRVLTTALQQLAARSPEPTEAPPFNQVVLTAPDIDADVFRRDIVPAILPTAERITLYASSDDNALVASKKIHGGYPRAGESGAGLVVLAGIDTIDASGIDTALLGHSYFAETAPVLADLVAVIHFGLGPERRQLTPGTVGSLPFWKVQPPPP